MNMHPMVKDRVTGLDRDNLGLDELVANNVMVHIERLDNGHFYIGVHYADGSARALWLYSKRPITVTNELRPALTQGLNPK